MRAAEKFDLSPRQREVAGMICAGKSRKEISSELGISESTVRHHVEILFQKTRAKTSLQLVVIFLSAI